MNILDFYAKENEKPLDNLAVDGGFTGIFRNIACIGDSLSSGEFEAFNEAGQKTYHDHYDYSWGQYIARLAGTNCYNISRGGMSAKHFVESFGWCVDYLATAKKCEATIIALGVNDVSQMMRDEYKFGFSVGDDPEVAFANGKKDFAGYYAQIIRNIREVNPYMHFFLVTVPRDESDEKRSEYYDLHREMLCALAKYFPRTYVMDLRTYAPEYDEAFKKQFYMGGHLNPAGYLLTAKIFTSYMDYIIRHNMSQFCQIGFTHEDTVNPQYFK